MKKITLLVILFALIQPVNAQWSTNPALNNAISDLSGEQVLPKIGLCSDGNIYIAFMSNVTGSYNVRLQKLDSQGNELWDHNGILISDHPTDSWISDWDMAVDINDHAVLTFSDVRAGGNWDVFAYRISPDGAFTWGDDGIALSDNSAFNVAPKVTCTNAGNAVFAWMSEDVIVMQKITPAGVKLWGDAGITLSSINSLKWPQLMPAGTDDIIMKYFDDAGSPQYPTRHVFAQRYNSSGVGIWSSPVVISNAGGISAQTQIFSFINDGTDGFYIAWHDDRDGNLIASSFVQHVNSSGQLVWPSNGVEVSLSGGYNHFYPYLALPQGSTDVYVFWNEMSGDQNQQGISGQKLSSTGARQWGNQGTTFIPLSYTPVYPEGASSSLTDMMVVYKIGGYNNNQIKGMKIAPDGSFLWTPSSTVISSVSSNKAYSVMSNFANDQWIVSWADNRNDANDIYAQNIAIDGSLGPYEILYGNIQGHVTLTGGSGNVTDVVVSAGDVTTAPNADGDYFFEVQTGTYTVTASLANYYTDEVTDVVVIENQTTSNVNLELVAIPTTGYISGTVELFDGNGDVTETVITAGTVTTNPDANGDYIMEVGVGIWSVTAELEGYVTQVHSNILVEPGLTTTDVDFLLTTIPVTGYLYGTVVIEGDMANVMLSTITIDTINISPDEEGEYVIEIPTGTYFVQAEHPYTEIDTGTAVIFPGGSTRQDFYLPMLRRDLIITCHDQFGDPLDNTLIEITGPEGNYSETMLEDSLVFEQVPYGSYTGMATYDETSIGTADTIIDQNNNRMDFEIILVSAPGRLVDPLIIFPNPVSKTGTINFNTSKLLEGNLLVYDSFGRKYSEIYINPENQQNFPVTLLFNNQKIRDGLYYIRFVSENGSFTGKILIKD
ncbi:MAG TPA: T9SS type A sorting domain-containing protein [Lentimicrobium sp.]|nr:T9SS type A sorting domain-containing protein [Lentimicrobium sp.]